MALVYQSHISDEPREAINGSRRTPHKEQSTQNLDLQDLDPPSQFGASRRCPFSGA
jgi:hypothetical protein